MPHARRPKIADVYQGSVRIPRPDNSAGPTKLLGRFVLGSQYFGVLQDALRHGFATVIICGCVRGYEVCEPLSMADAVKLGDFRRPLPPDP